MRIVVKIGVYELSYDDSDDIPFWIRNDDDEGMGLTEATAEAALDWYFREHF